MDISAIVLYKLLEEQSLDGWARLKLAYLDPSYSSLYTAINRHYNEYSRIPSFDDLEVTTRDTSLSRTVASLKELEDVPDVDLDIAIDALVDNYTQNQALLLLDKFVDTITVQSSQEVKDSLASVVMKLDELTHSSESVVTMNTVTIFETEDSQSRLSVPLGFNNTYDANIGAFLEELILLGGKRGSGKSIVCMNLCANQIDIGNAAAYFTIEMTAKETLDRYMSATAGVSHAKIRHNELDETDYIKLAKVRADMFEDSNDILQEFLETGDRFRLESRLIREKKLKDNQLVIIDDRELTLTAVDLHLQKLKAQFGDKFKLAVVDYLNQIVVPGSDIYDWTTQIYISKKLKEFARKYQICIASPYQIDDAGGTRFAKGILDAADVALLLDGHTKEDGIISFETTKIRGGPPIKIHSHIDWETLKIDPRDATPPNKKLTDKKEKEVEGKPAASADPNDKDLPW